MIKFRYLIKEADVLENLDELNKLGNEGWELVVIEPSNTNKVIFKRVILNAKENTINKVKKEDNSKNDKDYYDNFDFTNSKKINIYDDNNICIYFLGLEKGTSLFGGEAFSVKFLVENKTNQAIDVRALDVTLNGYILEKDTYISMDLPRKRKNVDFFFLNLSKLNDCNIYSISDINDFELKIYYETESGNKEKTSKQIKIEPFEIK